jgi:hypothetical protein
MIADQTDSNLMPERLEKPTAAVLLESGTEITMSASTGLSNARICRVCA